MGKGVPECTTSDSNLLIIRYLCQCCQIGNRRLRGRKPFANADLGGKVVPGGRVELPTPAFSGPRSTGELPRHRWNQRIVRAGKSRSKRLEVRGWRLELVACIGVVKRPKSIVPTPGPTSNLQPPTSSFYLTD